MGSTLQNSVKIRKIKIVFALAFLYSVSPVAAQGIIYDDFEGNRFLNYGERTGVLDSTSKNPEADKVNPSAKCALYIRNKGKKFDNIKMELPRRMSDVTAYATYLGVPPKLKLKVYTDAPVGTLVEILLGSRSGNNDYPAGTNSQYQAYTTKTNAWEELEFKFSQVPQGSETSMQQIDQITLLFNPNSSTSDTYYFDELTCPPLVVSKVDIVPPVDLTKNQETNKKNDNNKKNSPKKDGK